ncbi:unnamed protein product [Lactuca virosa]|uniref:C2H2-type domain-containing protein n=1 Tax=Lactuca virosa TaxID=75947 RepID=A0AAU9N1V3_9ASTR|nr:unnamed protein product [Lactuca virosa]
MDPRSDKSGENLDAQKQWLKLSLGPYLGGSSSSSRPTTSMKYTCSFCGKKFYSPQALGGHQNGHRRERDAAKRYRAVKINQSIMNVHSNLVVNTPARDRETHVARLLDDGDGFGVACVHPYAIEDSVDLEWPGSFYYNPQPASQQSDPNLLDLNLKL